MPTISQGLTTPSNVVTGGTIQATDVLTLYSQMNAFVIPATIGVWQQGQVNNTVNSVATGNNLDYTVAVSNQKAIMGMLSFKWTGAGASPTYTLRVNAASTGAVLTMTNAAAQFGLLLFFIGPHDTTNANRPVIFLGMDDGAVTTLRAASANVDLPNASTTSVGISVGGAGNTTVFPYARVWQEG